MNAKKRAVYSAVSYILLAAALALTIFLIVKGDIGEGSRVLICALVCIAAVLQVHYLIHELGHLLIGLSAGFRPVSFSVACVRFSRIGKRVSLIPNSAAAGACEMFPVGERMLKGRLVFYALSGALFNFIFSAAAILCYLLLQPSALLLFFVSLAPLNLYECAAELIPAELPAGKTDGKFALDLVKGEAGARNAFAVFRAQSLLAKGCFSDMPRAVLYDVPVVREDDPAFISLLSLRMMRAALSGERGEALANADRLSELKEYLPPYESVELAADCASVFWLFSEQEKAAALFSSAPAAKGSCAYWRIKAVSGENVDRETFSAWEKAIKKLPMQGQREWEMFFYDALRRSL